MTYVAKETAAILVRFEVLGYQTHYGEDFSMNIKADGDEQPLQYAMSYSTECWYISCRLTRDRTYRFSFHTQTAASERVLVLDTSALREVNKLVVRSDFDHKYRDSQIYNNCFDTLMRLDSEGGVDGTLGPPNVVGFEVFVPFYPSRGTRVYIVGNVVELGEWNIARALRLRYHKDRQFRLIGRLLPADVEIEYKFVLELPGERIFWERGQNRRLRLVSGARRVLVKAHFAYEDGDMAVLRPRFAGLNVPVFSINDGRAAAPRATRFGDFAALRELIRFCADANIAFIQLLPIQDTARGNAPVRLEPYNCISCFAFDHAYLDVPGAIHWLEGHLTAGGAPCLEGLSTTCTPKGVGDGAPSAYAAAHGEKLSMLRAVYTMLRRDGLIDDLVTPFERENAYWVYGYAVFKHGSAADHEALAALHGGQEQIRKYYMDHAVETRFYTFVQLLLAVELVALHEYAQDARVALVCDVPIGAGRDSVDVLEFSNNFNLDRAMGAPPDEFSPDGQNWGFPTYRWDSPETMFWWQARLAHLGRYFDALRVDHVLGFFRAWEMPLDVGPGGGRLGYFSPGSAFRLEEIYSEFRRERWTEMGISEFQRYFDERFARPEPMGAAAAASEAAANEVFVKHENDRYTPLYQNKYDETSAATFMALNAELRDFVRRCFISPYYSDEMHRGVLLAASNARLRLLCEAGRLIVAEDLGCVTPLISSQLAHHGLAGITIGGSNSARYNSVSQLSTHDMSNIVDALAADQRDGRLAARCSRLGVTAELGASLLEAMLMAELDTSCFLTMFLITDFLVFSYPDRWCCFSGKRINDPSNTEQAWDYYMEPGIEQLRDDDVAKYWAALLRGKGYF